MMKLTPGILLRRNDWPETKKSILYQEFKVVNLCILVIRVPWFSFPNMISFYDSTKIPKIISKKSFSHIWQPSNIYGNPATFNKRECNREHLHPKHFN